MSNEIENCCLCQRPSRLIYDNESWQHIKPEKDRGRQLAERFKVSLSFIRDLTRRYRETGKVEPKPHGGEAVAKLGVAKLPIVQALVKTQPDALLEELCERFATKTGINVSVSTKGRAVQKLGLSVKKKR